MCEKVQAALRHVREHHSEVTHVFFSEDGRWLYTDDDFNSPIFGPEIDESILEAASNAAWEDYGWPCAYVVVILDEPVCYY